MKNFPANRRTFLKLTAGAALSGSFIYYLLKSGFGKNIVRPQNTPEHFIVVISVPGGLDATQGLDPQYYTADIDSSDIFIEYNESEILKAGQLLLGPAARSLSSYYKEICIINGLSAPRNVSHSASLERMLTGTYPGNLNHYAIQLAEISKPMPLGTLTNDSITNRTSSVFTSNILNIGRKLNSRDSSLSINGLSTLLTDELKTAAEKLEKYDRFTGATFKSIHKNNSLSEICFSAIASCFASGLSMSAAIDIAKFLETSHLDSHTNHEVLHMSSQTKIWNSVAEFFGIFKAVPYKEKSLFDYTTFLVVTEFSRTPFLNALKGKDHNPFTNSLLLAGKGVNGNQTIGKSKVWSRHQTANGIPIHTGLPINLETGAVLSSNSEFADMITPENVGRTVLDIFNVSVYPEVLRKIKPLPKVKIL